MRAIIYVIFLSMLKVLVSTQTLEDVIVHQQNLPTGACDLLVVSPTGANEGRYILIWCLMNQISLLQILKEVPSGLTMLESF